MPGQSQKYIDANTASAEVDSWAHKAWLPAPHHHPVLSKGPYETPAAIEIPSATQLPTAIALSWCPNQLLAMAGAAAECAQHSAPRRNFGDRTSAKSVCKLHVEGRIACPIQCPCLCETVMILQGFVLSVSISLEYSKWLSQCEILGNTAWKPCQQIDLLKQNTWALLTKLPMYLVLTRQY